MDDLEQRLRGYLVGARPAWGPLDSFEPIAAGWESDIYAFRVPALGRLALRLYSGSEASRNAEREPIIMDALHKNGYPVPDVLLTEPSSAQLGRPFMVMEHIDGVVMGSLMEEPGRYGALVDQFGAMLASLHRLDPGPLLSRLDLQVGMDERLARWEQLALPEFQPAVQWLQEQQVAPLPSTVNHNDFHPHNIIIGPGGAATVIDWPHAEVADPRIDLAWTLLLEGSFVGEQARTETLAAYERHSGRQVQDLEYFDALAGTLRLHHFAVSLTLGPETMGMQQGAVDEMRAARQAYVWIRDLLEARTGLQIGLVDDLLG